VLESSEGPLEGFGGTVANSKHAVVEETDPSELKAITLYVNFFPISPPARVAVTYRRVGISLTAGSLFTLTSIVGFIVTPSSLNTA